MDIFRATRVSIGLLLGMYLVACQTVTPDTLNEDIADAAITAAVKTRLVTDAEMASAQISVETVKHRVYLSGLVPSPHEKARAHALALEVRGVVTVVDTLQIADKPQL